MNEKMKTTITKKNLLRIWITCSEQVLGGSLPKTKEILLPVIMTVDIVAGVFINFSVTLESCNKAVAVSMIVSL